MKTAIKKYLEKQIKNDSALSEKYDPKKLDKCSEYITDLAKKQLGGKPGYIEDAVVYKWARDFFLGDVPVEAKKEPEEIATSIPEEKETVKTPVANTQLSFEFGG